MKPSTFSSLAGTVLILLGAFSLAQSQTQTSSGIVERGEDYAVYQRVSSQTDASGGVVTPILFESANQPFEA